MHMLYISTYRIWCIVIFTVIIVNFNTTTTSRCQVQAQLIKPKMLPMDVLHPSNVHRIIIPAMKLSATLPNISRSFDARYTSRNSEKVPVGMQNAYYKAHNKNRRFMWSQIGDTVDTLMYGMADGMQAINRAVITPNGRRRRRHGPRYIPAASSLMKYVVKYPVKPNALKLLPVSSKPLSTKTTFYGEPELPHALHLGTDNYDYKLLEKMAEFDWEKRQNASWLGTDSDDWIPLIIGSSKPVSGLHTDVRPFVEKTHQSNTGLSEYINENIAAESIRNIVQHEPVETSSLEYQFIKTVSPTKPMEEPKTIRTSKTQNTTSPTFDGNSKKPIQDEEKTKLHASRIRTNSVRPSKKYTTISPESRSRGTMKFGDTLL